MTLDDAPEVLIVDEVAELLRCSPSTVYRMVAAGTLPACRIGSRTLRFARSAIAELLATPGVQL